MLIVVGLLAFVIEFAFMAGVFVLAAALVDGGVGGTVVGVVAVILVAALWGVFVAPKAQHRLPKVPRALVAGAAVSIVGAGLVSVGHDRFGLVLVGAGLVLAAAQVALDDAVPTSPRRERGDRPRSQRGSHRR